MLHELATNSAKYGAFGNNGSVSLGWEITPDGMCALSWKEEVASSSSPDTSAGFGKFVVEDSNHTTQWDHQ